MRKESFSRLEQHNLRLYVLVLQESKILVVILISVYLFLIWEAYWNSSPLLFQCFFTSDMNVLQDISDIAPMSGSIAVGSKAEVSAKPLFTRVILLPPLIWWKVSKYIKKFLLLAYVWLNISKTNLFVKLKKKTHTKKKNSEANDIACPGTFPKW